MKNKKALVTAATSGIGWASALALAKEGEYEDFNRFVTVNLASVIIPTQMALPLMAQRGGGLLDNCLR